MSEEKSPFVEIPLKVCPHCGDLMFLHRELNYWECKGCNRRYGAWLQKKSERTESSLKRAM